MLIPWNTAAHGASGTHWFGVLVDFQKQVVALSDPLIQDHEAVIEDVKWMLQLHCRYMKLMLSAGLCIGMCFCKGCSCGCLIAAFVLHNRFIGKSRHCRQPWSRTHVHKTLLEVNNKWKFVNLPSAFQIKQTDNYNCCVILLLVFWYQALNMQPMSEYCCRELYGCTPEKAFFTQVRKWLLIIIASNGNVWGSRWNRMEWNHTLECVEPYKLDLGQTLGSDLGSSRKGGLGHCPPNTRRTPGLAQRPILFASQNKPKPKPEVRKRRKKQEC